MKIAWFTPFDQRSAIGKVGVQICEKLSELGNSVDIWAYEKEKTLSTSLNVVNYDPAQLNISKLQKYDHVIYNMGNYAGYHWAIYEAMMQFPGILILHDRTMHNFYKQFCDIQYGVDSEKSKQAFLKMIQEEYGTIGKAAMEAFPTSDVITMNEYITRFAFIRKMCEKVKAVFTHSKSFTEAIKEYSFVPAAYAYLPCEVQEKKESKLPKSFVKDSEKFLVVSTGIVHPVKHIMEMANVVLSDQYIREHVQYVVIGDCGGPYGEELKRLATTELKDSLFTLGYQSDEVMMSFLNSADFCLNLRYPNAEACSLSLLEQMSYGKPIIVFDSGIYGEMPKDAVYKISMDNVEVQLSKAIRELIENKKIRKKLEANSRRFIETQCTISGYCKRLIEFLDSIKRENYTKHYSQILEDLHREIAYLGCNAQDVPGVLDDIISHTAATVNVQNSVCGNNDVVAIWAALPYQFPGLHREGIMKLYSRLVEALIDATVLKFEIWTYEVHREEILISFQKSLKKNPDRIKIITENNWMEQLSVPKLEQNLPWNISVEADNLGIVAGKFSEACIFAPIILYLDNVLQTHRPVYVPAMDMSVKHYYEEFTFRDPNRKFLARDIEGKVNRLFRSGMRGYCMSSPIRDTQILPLIRNSSNENIDIVWTPDMTSVCNGEYTYSENIIKNLGINTPYLFYPTQFRPNKNIETLMKAYEILIEKHQDLKLVFTGHLEEMPDLQREWKRMKSYSSLVFVHDLSEEELFNVYHYASCVPVTTVMEGGFPAQAIEAMKMNVPVVLANIPVVQERLQGCGMTSENCGLALFEPYDEKTLADLIQKALKNPDDFKDRQKQFWDVFNKYTWKEAAEKHYQLMMKAAGKDIDMK